MDQKDQLALAEGEWVPIPRVSRLVPFGYVLDENDPNLLLPVIEELEALELAKKHLRRFSYREVANWLSKVTGRYISHMGLKKRAEIDASRRGKAAALKNWANRLKEAQEQVAKYESQVPGSKKSVATSDS